MVRDNSLLDSKIFVAPSYGSNTTRTAKIVKNWLKTKDINCHFVKVSDNLQSNVDKFANVQLQMTDVTQQKKKSKNHFGAIVLSISQRQEMS